MPRSAAVSGSISTSSLSFNGAAAEVPRSGQHDDGRNVATVASMGPRLKCRGATAAIRQERPCSNSFNGAAAEVPRSALALAELVKPKAPRFNGAAAEVPRSAVRRSSELR